MNKIPKKPKKVQTKNSFLKNRHIHSLKKDNPSFHHLLKNQNFYRHNVFQNDQAAAKSLQSILKKQLPFQHSLAE